MGGDCTVVPVIGAVVVTYNAPAATVTACLRSLREAGGVDRCVLVDTGGRADVPADLTDTVEVLAVPNRGYGAAANAGWRRLRELDADVIAILNDDVAVRPGWIEALVPALAGRVGVAQPVIVGSGPGSAGVSSLGVEFDRYGAGVDVGRGGPPPPPGRFVPLEVFTGGAFVVTAAFLEATGGFDERWFLYYEDADLAFRGRELGWEYRLATSAVVEHTGGVSTSADSDRTRYLQERNRLLFVARHLAAPVLGRAIWLSVRRLRYEPRRVHASALAAGIARMPVRLIERWRARRISDGAAD
jgi:N-acetylglucosaminyl-diphospho-decaprenol L-rhamnosyltransferase